MAGFPNTGFEVTHPSSTQLTVVCHYLWWYALFAVVVFGIPAFRYWIRGIKTHQGQPIWWASVLTVTLIVVLSLFPTGSVTFDKDHGTVTFLKRGFFFIPHHYEYPLDQVRYASLETEAAARRFVVVFKGGARMGLTAYTSQGGQSAAVDAVNEFLGVYPPP